MFAVLGIDISSSSVDLVCLDENTDRADWTRIDLPGRTPFARCRTLDQLMPPPGWYLERGIYLIAIEKPKSRFYNSLAAQLPVFGAVTVLLPAEMEIWELTPTDWRQLVGLAGNAPKQAVREFVSARWTPAEVNGGRRASQDVYDAYCIAYAARELNRKAIERRQAA